MKKNILILLLTYVSIIAYATTPDTIRFMRANNISASASYANVSLACPDIELPSITGDKSSFRYIDAGCETSLTIRPSFGVSGGTITGYTVDAIPYAPPFPFDTGTKIFIDQDDVWGDVIQLPFKFCFFENTYSKAVVGANGLISFNTSVANLFSGWSLVGKDDIPSKDFLGELGMNWGNAIYGVFEDIDPRKITSKSTNGSIRYGLLGTYPCRTLTISWNKVPNYSCYSSSNYWDSFQIVLYEGTNVIDVYVKHKSRCVDWNLGRGIIGIQNKSCTKAIAAPNRNTTSHWTADNEAWRFSPKSTPQYTITYYEGMGVKGTVLGTGDKITIDPRSITAITARLQFTAANGDKFDLRDTAVIVRTEQQKIVTNKTLCENGSYEWRGHTYNQSGTYTEGVGYSNGCYDKIYELNLSINKQIGKKTTKNICQGESYKWNGKSYSETGTYYYQKRYSDGCETIDTLVLTVGKRYDFIEFDTICQGETYSWHNKTYSRTGSYTDYYQTRTGCDSNYTLQLFVADKYIFREKQKLCEGSVFNWRGKTYRDQGIYYDSLISAYGCDSIYQLELEIARNYLIEEYDSICEGDVYSWHGHSYTKSGTYSDHLSSIDGCDSIHILYLYVNKKYHFVEENGIRNSGTYSWRGKTLTQPGQYYDSLVTRIGCDSIYQLNLAYVRSYFYPYTAYICSGKTYKWRGRTYTEGGVYRDSLKAVNGADSVIQLHLVVADPFYSVEDITICKGESYLWHGQTYSQAGTYYDNYISYVGCDSVYQLNLKIGEPFYEKTDVNICTGETYVWRGDEYKKQGIYYNEYKTIDGCDSIYELNLIQNKTYFYSQSKTICQGEYYQWHGRRYYESGVYWDSLKTINACDSVYQLVLTVKEPFVAEEIATICDNETYYWRNKQCKTEGTYYDSLKTQIGCDSVYKLTLYVKPTYHTKMQAQICENETYEWRGNVYNQTDTYYEYLTTQDGCDSTFSLSLTVLPTFFYKEKAFICGGDAYEWHGKMYTEAGVYRDTLKTASGGCDSIVELTLGIAQDYYSEEEYFTCDGSFYYWHGKELSESGVYWDSLTTKYGCDSIFRLNVLFSPIHHYITKDTICKGETYFWRDSVYTIDSVYYDQYATIHECDSLYELQLTVLPTFHTLDTITMCHGDSILWHEKWLRTPGVYIDTLHTSSSCDSIVQLDLIENPIYHFDFYEAINEGEVFKWEGLNLTEKGDYYVSYQTILGCDSLLTMHLTVYPRYDFITIDTICEGEFYEWQDERYTQSGIYYRKYQTIQGNDSIYELRLTVMPTYYKSLSKYLCEGGLYTWQGKEILEPGIYWDSLKNSFGCDSILRLEIIGASVYQFDTYDTICSGESYLFEGKNYVEAGEYSVSYVSSRGCDSVYNLFLYQRTLPQPVLPIPDICADDPLIYIICDPSASYPITYRVSFDESAQNNGFLNQEGVLQDSLIIVQIPVQNSEKFLEPNTYSGVVELISDYCREVHTYDFTVNVLYPSSVVVQKFDDVLAVLNEKYNGGYTFSEYQWFANGELIQNATLPYFYGNGSLDATYYQVQLTRKSDGVTMMTCPIIPRRTLHNDTQTVDCYIAPTILDKHSQLINIHNSADVTELHVYSMDGFLILRKPVNAWMGSAAVELSLLEGMYVLRLLNSKGHSKTFKIIVR